MESRILMFTFNIYTPKNICCLSSPLPPSINQEMTSNFLFKFDSKICFTLLNATWSFELSSQVNALFSRSLNSLWSMTILLQQFLCILFFMWKLLCIIKAYSKLIHNKVYKNWANLPWSSTKRNEWTKEPWKLQTYYERETSRSV